MEKGKLLFELANGEKKWMTKQQYQHYINRLNGLKSVYNSYVELGYVNPNESVNNQVHALVELGSELMCDICDLADSITITGYNRIKNEINKNIKKPDFIEIVKYASCHKDKDERDDTKLTAKLLKTIDESVFSINFKRSFYNNFIEFDKYAVSEDPSNIIFPKLKASLNNKKFKEIVTSCAKARNYIDQQLWPLFQEYAAVAEYITKGSIGYNEYKQLVDYLHYQNIDDPRFKKQDKQYTVMIENFMKVYKLCKQFGYNYFDEVENYILAENIQSQD